MQAQGPAACYGQMVALLSEDAHGQWEQTPSTMSLQFDQFHSLECFRS
jgi:hypothetical protein